MKALIVIGSNFGDRKRNIELTLKELSNYGEIKDSSSIYESPDCLGSGRKYMNVVVWFCSDISYDELNKKTKDLEKRIGRTEEHRKRGEIIVDIDIVIFNGRILRPKDFQSSYFQIGLNQIYKDLD